MARRSSKGSDGASDTRDETMTPEATTPEGQAGQDSIPPEPTDDDTISPDRTTAEDVVADPAIEEAETVAAEGSDGDDTVTPDDDAATIAPDEADIVDAETVDTETVDTDGAQSPEDADTLSSEDTDTLAAEGVEPTVDTTPPPPAPAPVVQKRGPGFVPLVLGGVVAAGLGYGATYLGYLPMPGDDEATTRLETLIGQQSDALAALQNQVGDLAAMPAAPEVDLGPVIERIEALDGRISETADTIAAMATRVTTLEERPIFSGEVEADLAAAAETVTALEDQLRAQEEEAARIAAEAAAAQAAAEQAAAQAEADAQAAIAEAEAQAQVALAEAAAEAALGELRIATSTGAPFAEAVAAIGAATEVPEALTAAAETGVATVEELQDGFPAAARAALPVALRETAGDDPVDRVTAFLQGQVGGRSIEPREGDDPDAVLSRAQAAVDAADFATALTEISALPETARAEMADWMAEAETRAAVDAALVTVADALAGSN